MIISYKEAQKIERKKKKRKKSRKKKEQTSEKDIRLMRSIYTGEAKCKYCV
jgi:alpha-galactosidase/6-phospho-beta-glucosidase family protein